MADKISIQIGLDGADEVQQQLEGIGKAGQDAFSNIEKPAQDATQSLNEVSDAGAKARQSFLETTAEAARTGQEIAKLVGEIAKYSVEIGLTIQHHRGWVSELIKVASASNSAARAIALLGPAAGTVAASFVGAGAAITVAVIAIEAAEKVVTKFASSDEKLNNSLQTLAKNTGQAFDQLQHGKAVLEQLGISGDRFNEIATKINETADKTKVATVAFTSFGTAVQKSSDDALQALLKLITTVDRARAIEAGAKVGFSEEDVDRIRRLNAAGVSVEEIFQRVKSAGPLISPEASAAFDKMHDGILKVDSAWARLQQAWKSTVFTSLAAEISAALNNAKASVLNFAAATLETFNSLTSQISALLKGIGQSDIGKGIQETLRQSVSGLNTIIAEGIGGAMEKLGFSTQSIQAVKNEINGVAQAAQEAAQATGFATVAFDSFGRTAQQGAQQATTAMGQTASVLDTISSTGAAVWQVVVDGAAGAGQAIADFISKLTGISWDTISSGATTAWQEVMTAIQGAGTAIADFVTQIGSITWDVISSAGVAAWNAITGAIQGAINKLLEFIGLKERSGSGGGGGGAQGKARGGIIGGVGSGTSDSNLAWLSRGEYITPAHIVRQPGVLGFLEAMRRRGGIPRFADGGMFIRGFQDVGGGGVSDKIANWIVQIAQANNTAVRAMLDLVDSINRIHENLSNSLFHVTQDMNQVTRELVNRGLARGGLLGGRGTGTSDSNLAWVSRGEHIMPAAAVRQPGVLAFLEALRRSGGNLSAVLDGMGRFALGGLVPAGIGSMSHVTIQFPGLPPVGGLRASAAVVDELQRAAALAQVRSGGRKPSRYS